MSAYSSDDDRPAREFRFAEAAQLKPPPVAVGDESWAADTGIESRRFGPAPFALGPEPPPDTEQLPPAAAITELPFVDLRAFPVDRSAAQLISSEVARFYSALPYGFEAGVPLVALADVSETAMLSLRLALGGEARFARAARLELAAAIIDAVRRPRSRRRGRRPAWASERPGRPLPRDRPPPRRRAGRRRRLRQRRRSQGPRGRDRRAARERGRHVALRPRPLPAPGLRSSRWTSSKSPSPRTGPGRSSRTTEMDRSSSGRWKRQLAAANQAGTSRRKSSCRRRSRGGLQTVQVSPEWSRAARSPAPRCSRARSSCSAMQLVVGRPIDVAEDADRRGADRAEREPRQRERERRLGMVLVVDEQRLLADVGDVDDLGRAVAAAGARPSRVGAEADRLAVGEARCGSSCRRARRRRRRRCRCCSSGRSRRWPSPGARRPCAAPR